MKNLRMLIIQKRKCGSCFRSPRHLANSLRVLEWWGYPSASLPFDFLLENLIMLNLSHSCFQWDKPLKKSNSLSHLIFTDCEFIRRIPDISSSPNLTELCVDDCTNLAEIHDPVGFLDKLQRFSAKRCIKLKIVPCGIKLPSLEYLCLRGCSSLDIFPEILEPMEKLKIVDFEGTAIKDLPPSMQNLGGLQSLSLSCCTMLNIDALSNTVHMLSVLFPFLETLCLDDSNLKMIPECILECRFLKKLSVNRCDQLKKIRWLPENIRHVSAFECQSLDIDISPSYMLVDRISHERDILLFHTLRGERLLEWFDHTCRGNSVCFYFRNGIPDMIFGTVIARGVEKFDWIVRINNVFQLCFFRGGGSFDKTDMIQFHNYFRIALSLCPTLHLDDSWNYAEILVLPRDYSGRVLDTGEIVRWTGVYVNRQMASMQNIRFLGNIYDHSSFRNTKYCNSVSLISLSQMALCLQVEPSLCYLDVTGTSTDLDLARLLLGGSIAEDLQHQTPGTSFSRLFYQSLTTWEKKGSQHLMAKYSKDTYISVPDDENIDPAGLDHLKMAPGESFQAQGFVETTSSSDKVNGELDLNRYCTDESFRNQLEQDQDDAEMEGFYASLDAGTHVSSLSHDKSATTTPSEDAREALKIVQDFISNDASIFLHPEQCSVMKTSLDYLSNLSEDDGISGEMIAFISEASTEFALWSKDYIEAGMKIEFTASELLRADELEADLENNKKQFREVVAFQNDLLQKLAYMEERKKELEEQINAIKADISSSQSEKNIAGQRKRDIFEEGKMLKTQRDELREKEPLLQQEHGLAKETQTRIKDEWSKLGEKFKKIFIE